MEILFLAGIPLLLVGLSRPSWLWFAFPFIAFFTNRFFGTRTLEDVYTSKIPYGFLCAFLLAGFAYVGKSLTSSQPPIKQIPLFSACAFFLIAGLLSLLDTTYPTQGLKFLAGWCCYFLFFYIVVNALLASNVYKSFLIGNALNAGICAILMVIRASRAGFAPRSAEIWDITWLSSNEIGFYFEPIICICVCILFFSRKRFAWGGWVMALLPVLLIAIVFAGTRGTWVSLFATASVMLLRFPMRQKIRALIAVGTLAFVFYQALLFSPFAQQRISTLEGLTHPAVPGEQTVRSSINSRKYLMQVGLRMILAHPFNGVGLGNYSSYYHEYAPYVGDPTLQDLLSRSHTPHNFYLRFGAETGLAGLFATAFLLITVYRHLQAAIRIRHGEPWDSLLLGCFLGFIANVVHCLFQERIFGFYFWAFLGITYATLYHARKATGALPVEVRNHIAGKIVTHNRRGMANLGTGVVMGR